MYRFRSLPFLTVFFAAAFFVVSYFLPGPGAQPEYAGPAATIFSILLGFMVASAQSRMDDLYGRLKVENANNLTIYRLSKVFGPGVQDHIRKLLDNYLIVQIDYDIEDFDYSDHAFQKLYNYVINLNPKSDREKAVYTRLVTLLHESTVNRAHIEATGKDRLSHGQWTSILALMVVTISTIWSMSDGSFWGSVILTALASGVVLMVITMRDMNDFKWGNADWTWRPLHNLFKDLELVPYYPDDVLNHKEAFIDQGETIRVAHRPNKYPNMTGKVVNTVQFGQKSK